MSDKGVLAMARRTVLMDPEQSHRQSLRCFFNVLHYKREKAILQIYCKPILAFWKVQKFKNSLHLQN